MPYIKIEDRDKFDEILEQIKNSSINNSGELNYLITMICQLYIYQHEERYQYYNDIVGALENCKLELYRRKIAPYEDKKIVENSDCY